jgi:hypothetical protein
LTWDNAIGVITVLQPVYVKKKAKAEIQILYIRNPECLHSVCKLGVQRAAALAATYHNLAQMVIK